MPEDTRLGLHCFLPPDEGPPLFKDLHLCEPQGGLSRGGLLYQQQPRCTDHVAEPSDHGAVS